MTEKTSPAKDSVAKAAPAKAAPAKPAPEGERIAKVLSRAGVASRREAERMIEMGHVKVNGKLITSPALNVTAKDRITVNGEPLAEAEPARLWLYYKPEGLVTSNSDEKGRDTVFDHLPEDLPRVMSIGRLDLNSEGLLLLTNDGGLKRRLELPSTGWLRKYRVRINGNPTDVDLEPLRRGITVDEERFQPMLVVLDRIQGANAWLTIGLREGKNREIRRALNAINLTVNRLIRVSYGPFRLGDLAPGDVEEVKGRVLRDQLGEGPTPDEPKPARLRTSSSSKPAGTSAGKSAGTSAGKPARSASPQGAGLRELSDAWEAAVKPKPAARPARNAAEGAKPATPRKPAGLKPAAKPVAKSVAKSGTRKPREIDSADPAKRSRPTAAAKPGSKPGTKPGSKAGIGAARKPPAKSGPKPATGARGRPTPRA